MRGSLVGVMVAALLVAGCGGRRGGGASTGATKRVFVVPHVLEASSRGVRVALGDVNGDGLMDMCVQEDQQSSVEVLLSTGLRESPTLQSLEPRPPKIKRGAEAYRSSQHVLVWDTTSDLALADMNRDGFPDLVVAGGSAHTIGIWLADSQGNGQFSAAGMILVPTNVDCDRVATGDVNGDGRPDLVCLDETTGSLRVLVADATLHFTVDASPPDVGACFGLVLADVDRDGKPDCVTNRPDSDVVTLFTWTTGVLAPRDVATGQATGRCMAVGDVDGDGWLDVCVLGEGGTSVACLHQNPAQPGSFDASTSPLGIAIDEAGVHVCVPAVQRRGIVTGCGAGSYRSIDTDGGIEMGIAIDEPGVHLTGRPVGQPGLALADVDGDGLLDLVALTASGREAVVAQALRESPTRRFGTATRMGLDLPLGHLCACADLDLDGSMDFVACDDASASIHPLYSGHAQATNPLYSPSDLSTQVSVSWVVAADIDLDGLPDLVMATSQGLGIQFQDATARGTFLPPVPLIPGVTFARVAVGDLNGDGRPDLVATTLSGACFTLLRDPASPRAFATIQVIVASPFTVFALGDTNGDGKLDLFVARTGGGGQELVGKGDGTFDGTTPALTTGVTDPADIALADVDGDGHLDACVCGDDHTVVVYQLSGPFRWFSRTNLDTMAGRRVAAGDVNGDGRCDLCVSGLFGVQCAIQSAFRRGDLLPSHSLSTDAAGGLAIGDFDGDGRVDCCFCDSKTGECRCVEADPDDDSPPSLRLNGLPPGEPVIGTLCVTGDLDGDGRLDVLLGAPRLGAAGTVLTLFRRN